jgi:hypothetical protein
MLLHAGPGARSSLYAYICRLAREPPVPRAAVLPNRDAFETAIFPGEVRCARPESRLATGIRRPVWIFQFPESKGLRQIFLARVSGISLCLGTASTAPVAGLLHKECDRPSRFRKQPCVLRC